MTTAPTDTTTTPANNNTTEDKTTMELKCGGRLMPEGWKPSENEVIIGRGKRVHNHNGNRRFLALVQAELVTYSQAPSKTEKSYILAKILHQVQRWSGKERIGFVKLDPKTKRWVSPKDSVSRVTVAQAFRDALSNRYSSSKHSKQRKRQIAKGYISEEDSQFHDDMIIHAGAGAGAGAGHPMPMQTPAMSLRSMVHQGLRGGSATAPLQGMTAQETLAQIRSFIQQGTGRTIPQGNTTAVRTNFLAQARTLSQQTHPASTVGTSQHRRGQAPNGLPSSFLSFPMQTQLQHQQSPFSMMSTPTGGNIPMTTSLVQQQATLAGDVFEPLPIDEQQLQLQHHQFQLQQQQQQQQQQELEDAPLAFPDLGGMLGVVAAANQTNPKALTDDAFDASEQSSAFFLHTGNTSTGTSSNLTNSNRPALALMQPF